MFGGRAVVALEETFSICNASNCGPARASVLGHASRSWRAGGRGVWVGSTRTPHRRRTTLPRWVSRASRAVTMQFFSCPSKASSFGRMFLQTDVDGSNGYSLCKSEVHNLVPRIVLQELTIGVAQLGLELIFIELQGSC